MSNRQNNSNTDSFWTHTRLKKIVIGQCTLTVGILVILLSIVIRWSINRHDPFDYVEKTVCVPCKELTWSGNEELTVFEQRNETNADYMTCCSVVSKVIDRLVEKHAISKHNQLKSTRIIGSLEDDCVGQKKNPQKPYVKMTGINFTAMENDEDGIIRWNITEYDGEVKPMDGKIFIKDPGYYYVLSNLKLKIPMTNYNIVHSHYVYVHSYNRGTLRPVLENSRSFCETTSSTNEIVSTVGAVFQLEKHDKLFVQSSHPQHLISSDYSNVFALYKM